MDPFQDSRTIVGEHDAAALSDGNMPQQLAALSEISPPLSRFLLEHGFGEVAASGTVDYREWNMMVLASLMAMGDAADQSEVYLKGALAHGATEQEIQDVLNIAYLYAGAPRAVNGARRMQSYLDAVRKRLGGAIERRLVLSDHSTILWDTAGQGIEAKGVPMILIHALDMDHHFWRSIVPHLAKKGRVIAYDMRGHGGARGAPLITSLDQLGDDLVDLMDRLEIPVADIYGSSFGGAVTQYAILRKPERFRSMALLATGAKAPQAELAARAVDAEQHGMDAQVARSVTRWFHPETIAENPWEVRYARHCVRRARVEEWAAAWRAMSFLDVNDRAAEVKQPVLVLSGTSDLSSTPEIMQATADVYPTSTFVSIEGGTHMMPMEDPEPVAAALAKFRDDVEVKARADLTKQD